MDFKKIRKGISRFFGWLGLSFCSLILKALPIEYIYGFAGGIACIGYRIAAKQRRIALESLKVAFGQNKTSKEIERIARDCFTCMAKSGVEVVFLMDKPALLRRRVQVIGRENLDTALAKGRGVILISAHFGNFPLVLAKLSLEGYKSVGIMRPMRDARVEKIFLSKRDRLGIKTIYSIPRKTCVEETLRSLRDNKVIFIPLDQNFGTGGIFVDFFGTKAATATGPVVLARRTGATLLPCFIIRQPDNRHQIIFEPPFDLQEAKTTQETVLVNIQRLTEIIEAYIRRYPEQWGWIHKRWKSRPN